MARIGYLLPTRDIVAGSDPSTAVSRTQSEVVVAAQKAESYGFNSLWVGDSMMTKPRHDPLVTLSSVASVTNSVDLGTAVYLPALRHPIVVAQQTATLSLLSGGRFRFGVGVGGGSDVEHEYEQLNLPYKRRGGLLNEHLDIVQALWENETVDREGEFFSIADAGIGMTPVTNPSVYIASLRVPESGEFPPTIRDRIRRHGDGWLPGQLTPTAYEMGLQRVDSLSGRPADALMYVDLLIGDDDWCREQASRFLDRYYPDESESTPDEVLEKAITGSEAEVREQLARYERAGVQEFVVRIPSTAQFDQLRKVGRIIADQKTTSEAVTV